MPARREDLAVLVELLNEVDAYYGDSVRESSSERAARIEKALFLESASAAVLLARNEESYAIGMASYSFLWPAAGSSRSLFLKELYVRDAYRRSGVGRILMDELFKLAAEQNCSRVEWQTDRPNTDAQQFYNSIGVTPIEDKIFYRFSLES
jgi:GNAT superfamily N-acetyltransferase